MDIWFLAITFVIFGNELPMYNLDKYYTTQEQCMQVAERKAREYVKEHPEENPFADIKEAYCKRVRITIDK